MIMKVASIATLVSCLVVDAHAQAGLRGSTDNSVSNATGEALFHDPSTTVADMDRRKRNSAEDFSWMYGGVDSFQQCPAGQAVRGLCSSGKNPDCDRFNPASYTSTGCSFFDGQPSESAQTQWICARYGQDATCPAGMVMVGACGSGEFADCRRYCNPNSHTAIKCATLKSEVEFTTTFWSQPLDQGVYGSCPGENSAMCGVCQSGKNPDCNGGYARIKCCGIGYKLEAYHVVGYWEDQFEVVGEVEYSLKHGSKRTSSFSTTQSWSQSVTASVEAGLEVEGLGVTSSLSTTVSKSYARTYKQEWETSEEETFTITVGGSLHRPDPQALSIDRYYLTGNVDVGGNYYNDPNGEALTDGSSGAPSSGEVVAWYYPDGEGDSDPVEVGQVTFYLDREAVVTEVQVDFFANYCSGLDVPKQIEVSIGQGKSFVLDGPATGMTTGHFSVVLDLSDENLEPVSTITLGILSRAFPGAPRFAPGRCGHPYTSSKVGISEVSFVGYYGG